MQRIGVKVPCCSLFLACEVQWSQVIHMPASPHVRFPGESRCRVQTPRRRTKTTAAIKMKQKRVFLQGTAMLGTVPTLRLAASLVPAALLHRAVAAHQALMRRPRFMHCCTTYIHPKKPRKLKNIYSLGGSGAREFMRTILAAHRPGQVQI